MDFGDWIDAHPLLAALSAWGIGGLVGLVIGLIIFL